MTASRARRRSVVALWLILALASAAVAPGLVAAQDATADPEVAATTGPDPAGEAAPGSSPSPTAEAAGVAIRTDLVVDGLVAPVYLADDGVPGKSCLYVVERGGIVRIVDDNGVRPKPFLDISDLVLVGPEQGLHAVAFHPAFQKNGRFFVHYNAAPDGDSVIAEFRGRPCKPANQKPVKPSILTVEQPYPNNNGGWIGFGPDGFLYIPLGDGGGATGDPDRIGQAPTPLLAKVLRINVDVKRDKRYAIPKDNPYRKKRKDNVPRETWARGLRDPRRASFDRATGDLWIGEAGQTIEEVNRIPAGVADLNFGWSAVEGASTCHANVPDCDPSRYEAPVFAYEQVPPHRAITGGYVYRGDAIRELQGVYLFSDLASGFIWGLDTEAVAAGQPVAADVLLDAPQGFVSFGEDDAGELYVVSLDGSVYRINAEES